MGRKAREGLCFWRERAMLDDSGMAGLPMAHPIEDEEIFPVREYERFAQDVKGRWNSISGPAAPQMRFRRGRGVIRSG